VPAKTECSPPSISVKPRHGHAGSPGACRSQYSNARRNFLATTSPLAQRAAPDQRHEVAAFERDAALATTAQALSATPTDALSPSAASAELADRLTITQQGQDFRFELIGDRGGGATGMVLRAEFQRILRMLEGEVIKAGWVNVIAASAPVAQEGAPKPARH
jgi:hypothetical protein